jgi:hypothetical protein
MKTGVYASKESMEIIQVYLDHDWESEFYAVFSKAFSCDCGCLNCTYKGKPVTGDDHEMIKRRFVYLGPL